VVLGEQLDQAAHVGALEVVRQAHRDREARDGLLAVVGAVEDDDGVAQVGHPDLVDWDVAGVGAVLDVFHAGAFGGAGRPAHGMLSFYQGGEGETIGFQGRLPMNELKPVGEPPAAPEEIRKKHEHH
jgi:hypothetical protein